MTQTSPDTGETDTALAVLRTMVAIGESTVEDATGELTLTQFRVLRTVVDHTPVTGSRVAAELGMNPSSVTRACDRLTALGLLRRAQNPLNKREILLAPTATGRLAVERVNNSRHAILAEILGSLTPEARSATVAAFAVFNDAAAAVGLPGTW
ncbi:MAG TPA: MarR family transcriptional regulator [Amycolatopsis sp.]|nr:MarR family transcriptional regulator [Amycolatopsis sp.]